MSLPRYWSKRFTFAVSGGTMTTADRKGWRVTFSNPQVSRGSAFLAQTTGKAGHGSLLEHLRYGMRESVFLVLLVITIYTFVALLSYDPGDSAWSRSGVSEVARNLGGVAGAWLADILLYFLGYPAFLLPLLALTAGWLALYHERGLGLAHSRALSIRVTGLLVTLVAGCGLAALLLSSDPRWLPASAGGVLGDLVSSGLRGGVGFFGAGLFLIGLFLIGLNLCTGISWLAIVDAIGKATLAGLVWLASISVAATQALRRVQWRRRRPEAVANGPQRGPTSTVGEGRSGDAKTLSSKISALTVDARTQTPVSFDLSETPTQIADEADSRVARKRKGTSAPKPSPGLPTPRIKQNEFDLAGLPPMDLLDAMRPAKGGYSPEVLETLSRQVEAKLQDFGIQVEVVEVQPGPVITRFELQPAPGVKVSQISNLAKDVARGLSVIAVRVVEVVPGKSVIGLEIPNNQREMVTLGEILSSSTYRQSESPLTLALGKDIAGHSVVANLAKMPHLLVAGTTGSGKSVAINVMLLSMLYKSSADEVRLILVDPKMLELSIYEGIPHLLAPVVTDMKDAACALRWCVAEMERRYRLMAALKVRNIAGFNARVREAERAGEPIKDPFFVPDVEPDAEPPVLEALPFIVVVIDELADLMMVVGKKVEELIARLAQKARAAGIHLILATQRPSVDVITGLIKANIPTRIAFQVSSKVDSRTIIDQMGAETLLGHGDMLFLPPGTGFPQRLHGAFVDDHEVNAVVEFLKQTGVPDYVEAILEGDAEDSDPLSIGTDLDDSEQDPLYDQAVRIVTESRRASASGIQRRLKIGYNRAARLIEAMEIAGIVSSQGSNGMREVVAAPPPED